MKRYNKILTMPDISPDKKPIKIKPIWLIELYAKKRFHFFCNKAPKDPNNKDKKDNIKNIFFQIEKKSWKLKKKIRNNKVIITNLGKNSKKRLLCL